MNTRRRVNKIADKIRLALDTFPSLDYQPLPWIGKENARRGNGTEGRWQAIREVLAEEGVSTVLDIGANVGWFSISCALDGYKTVAVESDGKYYRPLLYAAEKLGLQERMGLLVLTVAEENAPLLPPCDAVLMLSVWHHVVKGSGISAATKLLAKIWDKTGSVLVFETGRLRCRSRTDSLTSGESQRIGSRAIWRRSAGVGL